MPRRDPPRPPRVFISYSHDSPEHSERMLALADRLRSEGVDAWLDQYEPAPPLGWPRWMVDQLEAADFVLVVCTETYHRRFRAQEEAGKGLGVAWEGAILAQHLYDAQTRNTRFIPVVFGSDSTEHTPVLLRGATHYEVATEAGYEALYRRLTDQPGVPVPELGKLRKLAAKKRRTDFFAIPEPSQADERLQELSVALEGAQRTLEERTIAGEDTTAVCAEILEIKRRLREGGQLRAGDFLAGGQFRLIEPLGRGGFATVWKAWDRLRCELVALKVLHGQFAEDRTRRERFFRGARKMASLFHPGIVRVLEEEVFDEGYYFFAMEYVEGGDLRRAVVEGRLSREEALAVVLEVGEALHYAHEHGLVHRDVKPANVLLGAKNRPKLTDFDLVRASDTTGGTRTAAHLGTFLYTAPEAMAEAKEAGFAADVYSLGMTLAFVLHGRDLPWAAMGNAAAFRESLPCSEAIKAVLARATAPEAGDRYASVAELLRALAEARRVGVDGEQGKGGKKGREPTPPQRRSPRRPAGKGRPPRDLLTKLRSDDPFPALGADWKERARAYSRVRALVTSAEEALDLVDRLRRRTRSGNDLYFLDVAVRQVGQRWPEHARAAEKLRGRLYDHIPAPDEDLFEWVDTPLDGRVPLWRKVPADAFWMGSPEGEGEDREHPRHRVRFNRGYQIAAVPVTNAQYAAFDPRHEPRRWEGVPEEELAHHPVGVVTWFEAVSFCRWLATVDQRLRGARLPTEEEWEHACRAGTETRYWSGDGEGDLARVGWYAANSGGRTHWVGEKPANPWGLYDVHGNVWEWTVTPWDPEAYAKRREVIEVDPSEVEWEAYAPTGPSGGSRVTRGGSAWGGAGWARAACRDFGNPEFRGGVQGFRVVLPGAPSR